MSALKKRVYHHDGESLFFSLRMIFVKYCAYHPALDGGETYS